MTVIKVKGHAAPQATIQYFAIDVLNPGTNLAIEHVERDRSILEVPRHGTCARRNWRPSFFSAVVRNCLIFS